MNWWEDEGNWIMAGIVLAFALMLAGGIGALFTLALPWYSNSLIVGFAMLAIIWIIVS